MYAAHNIRAIVHYIWIGLLSEISSRTSHYYMPAFTVFCLSFCENGSVLCRVGRVESKNTTNSRTRTRNWTILCLHVLGSMKSKCSKRTVVPCRPTVHQKDYSIGIIIFVVVIGLVVVALIIIVVIIIVMQYSSSCRRHLNHRCSHHPRRSNSRPSSFCLPVIIKWCCQRHIMLTLNGWQPHGLRQVTAFITAFIRGSRINFVLNSGHSLYRINSLPLVGQGSIPISLQDIPQSFVFLIQHLL